MGMPEKDGRCKMHPIHRQSNGVCPHCLRERLNNISSSSSSTAPSNPAYYSDDIDDISSSASSSPDGEGRGARGLSRLFLKSRSFVFPSHKGQERRRPAKEAEGKKSKKGRFWAELMTAGEARRRVAEKGGISSSKTVKEKSLSKWPSFFA